MTPKPTQTVLDGFPSVPGGINDDMLRIIPDGRMSSRRTAPRLLDGADLTLFDLRSDNAIHTQIEFLMGASALHRGRRR